MADPGKKRGGEVQGEGDYRSAREFDEKERSFVQSHDTEKLARDAEPESSAKDEELKRAEEEGKARGRPDPEVEPAKPGGGAKPPPRPTR
jgi:hypothetical protein